MRVLIVDDNEMNRTVVRCMLDAAGLESAEAEGAETGLAMLDAADYDVVLMDLRMPGMDGLAAIRQIRDRPDAKAETPVVVLTADNAHDIREQALGAGADDLLLKPVDLDSLMDAMGRAIKTLG